MDSARRAIQPGLRILARHFQTGLGFPARAEKGARACLSIVFLHLSKFSRGNLCFAPGLKLSM